MSHSLQIANNSIDNGIKIFVEKWKIQRYPDWLHMCLSIVFQTWIWFTMTTVIVF